MITKATFSLSRRRYGFHSSWAVWSSLDAKSGPKYNMADLSMFEEINLQKTLKKLHTRYVLARLRGFAPDVCPVQGF